MNTLSVIAFEINPNQKHFKTKQKNKTSVNRCRLILETGSECYIEKFKSSALVKVLFYLKIKLLLKASWVDIKYLNTLLSLMIKYTK